MTELLILKFSSVFHSYSVNILSNRKNFQWLSQSSTEYRTTIILHEYCSYVSWKHHLLQSDAIPLYSNGKCKLARPTENSVLPFILSKIHPQTTMTDVTYVFKSIDWLIGYYFTPYQRYLSHVTAVIKSIIDVIFSKIMKYCIFLSTCEQKY